MTKGAKRKQAEEPAAAAPEPKAAKKADAAPPAKKKARQAEAGPKKAAAAPSKAAAAPKKKGGSEIDAIFSIGSTAKQPADSEAELGPELKEVAERIKKAREAKGSTEAAAADKKKPKVEGSKDDLFGADIKKNRKKTEEGYNIYSEEELGLTKKGGGDTDLCPFDCDCCY